MSLRQGLDLIAPALRSTTRYIKPIVSYRDDHLSAYNGDVFARVPIDLDEIDEFDCDSVKLNKVVDATSQILVGKQEITVVTGGTKFHIRKVPFDEVLEMPVVTGDIHRLSKDFVVAIGAISRFASANAIHPWACVVHVTGDMIVATNNVALAASQLKTPFAATLPCELIPQLVPGDGLIIGDAMIAVCRPGGLTLQYRLPSSETPAVILKLAMTLTACETPFHGFAGALARFDRMDDVVSLAFEPGRLVVGSDHGDILGERPFDCGFSFRISIEAARLLAACGATHVDASQAPESLRFSRGCEVPLRGILAGRH
jgi:hypothetical protein